MPATTFRPLKIGAGGFITGLDNSPDGLTRIIWTDTFGGYLWNTSTSQWDQLVTMSGMPAGYAGIDSANGVYAMAVAPSDSTRIYMTYSAVVVSKQSVFKSTNRGATFSLTNFTAVNANPNDQLSGANYGQPPRVFGRKMAVDPVNPDVVLFGTEANGLFRTLNGGTSWTACTDVLTSTTTGGVLVAFDKSSAVVSGKTQGIYASSQNRGVYHSTDGGATWTLLNSAGMPTSHFHMVVNSAGVLWLSEGATYGGAQNLKKYSGGVWSYSTAGGRCHAIAIDPTDDNHIVIGSDYGSINVTTNGGSSWAGENAGFTRVSPIIPWLAWTNESYMSDGDMMFSYAVPGQLDFAQGIGVWKTTPPSTVVAFNWTAESVGIEQIIVNDIRHPPGGVAIVAGWDRGLFRITDPDSFPSTHKPTSTFQHAWCLDWATSDPNYIAARCTSLATETSSYSTDGGVTWTQFTTFPDMVPTPGSIYQGGCIAASTPLNIVFVGSSKTDPYYTLNGGTTWTKVTGLSGVPSGDGSTDTGWGNFYFYKRQIVCADRVTPNVFRMYNYGVGGNSGGVWESTDGGVSWTNVSSTINGVSQKTFPLAYYHTKMKSVPGFADHMFFTESQIGGMGDTNPNGQPLYRTTNGGRDWTIVPNLLEVYDFDFGAIAPGQSYPTVFVTGWLSGTWGIYRSDDNCATWTFLDDYPLDWGDPPFTIGANPTTYGTVYAAGGGSGAVYGRFDVPSSVPLARPRLR